MDAVNFAIACCDYAQTEMRMLFPFERALIGSLEDDQHHISITTLKNSARELAPSYGQDKDEAAEEVVNTGTLGFMAAYFLWRKAAKRAEWLSERCTIQELYEAIAELAYHFSMGWRPVIGPGAIIEKLKMQGIIRD